MTDDSGAPAAAPVPAAGGSVDPEFPPRKPSATALVVGIVLLVVGLVLFQAGQQMFVDGMVVLEDGQPPSGDVPYYLGLITAAVGLVVVLAEVWRLAKQLDVVYNRAIGAPPGGE
ncbi:hypothetical protein ACFQ80_04930 [Isoptericola sp. NPDC056578]|uniref:hypothetical protein n=1 Tax=Isoptericola sp. NPDC056578 TaxID=3345870 RepID=UPI0036817C3F